MKVNESARAKETYQLQVNKQATKKNNSINVPIVNSKESSRTPKPSASEFKRVSNEPEQYSYMEGQLNEFRWPSISAGQERKVSEQK